MSNAPERKAVGLPLKHPSQDAPLRFRHRRDERQYSALPRCSRRVVATSVSGQKLLFAKVDPAVVTPSEKPESALQEIREALVTHGEELGFNSSVVGLTLEDVARLSSTGDPWWGGVEANALLILGPRLDELATKTCQKALA